MSDLNKYIENRKSIDLDFAESFEEGYDNFKIGVLLKKLREESGMTQDELAKKMNTKKTAISRIENHAEDIRLATLEKYAKALGRKLQIKISKKKEKID